MNKPLLPLTKFGLVMTALVPTVFGLIGLVAPNLVNSLLWPWKPRDQRNGLRPASRFLRQHRSALVAQVSHWVGVEPVVVKDLLSKCISRAEALRLQVAKDQETRTLVAMVSYLTTLCSNYAAKGKYLLEG